MRRALTVLAGPLLLGVSLGCVVGACEALVQGWLANGLFALALHAWAVSACEYAAVGAAAGLAAHAIRTLSSRVRATGGGSLVPWEAIAWGVATLPVWGWLVLRDRWLLPGGRGPALVFLVAMTLLHVGVWVLRRDALRTAGSGGRRVPLAIAACVVVLVAVVTDRAVWTQRGRSDRPDVLLIVVDTLRADRLSVYGYARPTSPEIDAFAREAIRFTNFHSTSSWTLPSHASLFTGFFPVRHRATQERARLDRGFVTLAEVFRDAGYRTFGASGNPWVGASVNLDQGFDEFIDTWREGHGLPRPTDRPHPANRAYDRFLAARGSRSSFVFLNYIDPHVPYLPPEPWLSRFQQPGTSREEIARAVRRSWGEYALGVEFSPREIGILSDLYDAEVAYTSHAIGQLLERLGRDPRGRETLVVVTSDHGEHFGEHGLGGHMFGLYGVTVRVPLLIRLPDSRRRGQVEARAGQLVDLFPTLLAAAGLEHERFGHHGVDLLAPGTARESVLAEYYYPLRDFEGVRRLGIPDSERRLDPYRRRLRAIQARGYRLIWSSDGRHELYDVLRDPAETRDLYGTPETDSVFADLMDELEAAVAASADGEPIGPPPVARDAGARELDAATRDALRALGYAD